MEQLAVLSEADVWGCVGSLKNYGVPKMPGQFLGNSGTLFLLRSIMIRNVVEDTLGRSHPRAGAFFMLGLGGLKGMGKENGPRSKGVTT